MSIIQKRLERLKVACCQWLFFKRQVDVLEAQCEQYVKSGQTSAVFRFTLCVDPCELCEHNSQLGNCLLHDPPAAWQLFQEVSFTIIQTAEWLPLLRNPSQMLLILRLTNIPSLPGYTCTSNTEVLKSSDPPRFVSISGVVCSVSQLMNYSQSTVFRCRTEGCAVGGGRTDDSPEGCIRVHAVGRKEAELTRWKPTCSRCGEYQVEDISCRTLSEKRIVRLAPVGSMSMTRVQLSGEEGYWYSALNIVLRDDLCHNVVMGAEYTVIGIAVAHDVELPTAPGGSATIPVHLEANNFVLSQSASLSIPLEPQSLPQKLLDVYKACSYSPWTFTASMAYTFAGGLCSNSVLCTNDVLISTLTVVSEVAPPGLYHRLKLSILLSLVTCESSGSSVGRHPVHLLAIDNDTQMLTNLFAYSGTLAPRAVVHNSGGDLLGSVRKEGDLFHVDGGSMVLSSGGICMVGNVSTLKKDTSDKLRKALESGRIALDVKKQFQVEEGVLSTAWPVQCGVWAYADQLKRKAGFAKSDVEILKQHSMHEFTTISKALADGFTLVLLTGISESNEHAVMMLTEHILSRATGSSQDPPVEKSSVQQLITCARGIRTDFSQEAQNLIQSFYSASRRVRTSSVYGTDMTVTSLDAMTTLAEAHAKLSLRREVTVYDAVLAILLYEESLVDRFGYSVLNVSPAHHFKSDNTGSYIGLEFDQWMRQVHSIILQFCKCHGPRFDPGPSQPPTILTNEE